MLQRYNDKNTQQKRAQTTNHLTCTNDPLLTCTDEPRTNSYMSTRAVMCLPSGHKTPSQGSCVRRRPQASHSGWGKFCSTQWRDCQRGVKHCKFAWFQLWCPHPPRPKADCVGSCRIADVPVQVLPFWALVYFYHWVLALFPMLSEKLEELRCASTSCSQC